MIEPMLPPVPAPMSIPISPSQMNPQPQPDMHPAAPPNKNGNCGSSERCDAVADQIVFPKECGNTQANNKIESILKAASQNGQVHVSKDVACRGVFAWMAEKVKASRLEEIRSLVEAVVPNRPLGRYAFQEASFPDPEVPREATVPGSDQAENSKDQAEPGSIATAENPTESSGGDVVATNSGLSEEDPTIDTNLDNILDSRAIPARHEGSATVVKVKRDYAVEPDVKIEKRRAGVIVDNNALRQLTFIATPADAPRAEQYPYPGSPYLPVTIYSISSGVDELHTDFISPSGKKLISKFIYTPDLPSKDREKTDADEKVGWGTCVLSLTCGKRPGVFKEPVEVIVVKSPSTLSGLAFAYADLLGDMNKRAESSRGRVILSVHELIPHDETYVGKKVRSIVRLLIENFGVVVLSPADHNDGEKLVEGYPSVYAVEPPLLPIIVAGAVDLVNGNIHQSTYAKGPASYLTVGAPGAVQCSQAGGNHQELQILGAQATASALTAGVAALLMADQKFGKAIQKSPNPADLVRACIVELAQPRGNIKSIWTGVDIRFPNKNYGWPPKLKCMKGLLADNTDETEEENV